jgi:hypothetical protein
MPVFCLPLHFAVEWADHKNIDRDKNIATVATPSLDLKNDSLCVGDGTPTVKSLTSHSVPPYEEMVPAATPMKDERPMLQ